MAQATDGKTLETNLKKAALGCAYICTPPTGFQPIDPPSNSDESLEDKVRRVRQEGSVYKWDASEAKSGNSQK